MATAAQRKAEKYEERIAALGDALIEARRERDGLDKAVNYALGALLDPDAKRRAAAIAHVSEMVHLAFNPPTDGVDDAG